jgi:hypothetical protein
VHRVRAEVFEPEVVLAVVFRVTEAPRRLGTWRQAVEQAAFVGERLARRVVPPGRRRTVHIPDRIRSAFADRILSRSSPPAMQFNAVVETNEHKVRLWESLGFTTLRVCASTKSAASDITTSGSPHPHQAPPRR